MTYPTAHCKENKELAAVAIIYSHCESIIVNMASLFQAIKDGSMALLVEWVEFESDAYTTIKAEVQGVRYLFKRCISLVSI